MDEYKTCKYPYTRYEVNKLGIIRNLKTKIVKSYRENLQGYVLVTLLNDVVIDGKYKIDNVRVHKIVVLTYLGEKPEDGYSIDHINRDKKDNRLINLKWATKSEQSFNRHVSKTTLRKGNSDLSVLQYDKSHNLIREFKNAYEVTSELGISKTHLSSICLGKVKNPVCGFFFKYKEQIDLDGEYWKDFIFNDKTIQISNHGRIKSNNRILSGSSCPTGYKVVSISNNGIRKCELAHRLVANCFLKKSDDNKNIVNHKDQNKQNNHVDNLEWCSYSENMIHFYKNTGSKLCKKIMQLDNKNNIIKIHLSLADAAKALNIKNKSNITTKIKNKKPYHGFYWSYV